MRAVVTVLLATVLAAAAAAPPATSIESHPPGADMTTPQLIKQQGYPVEVHHVRTSDGYLLELHRIPHGINDTASTGRPVAFVQHGILSSSADWVMNRPNEALAYLLADAGYDVWLSNFRGNTYSRSHSTLDPDTDLDFWDFSWDEMGLIDLPTMIDYTLATTGMEDLYFVGFSMGTTGFFAMMSEMPEYDEKVRVMIALAPVAYIDHVKGPLRYVAPFSAELDFLMQLLGRGEFLPSRNITDQWVESYCDDEAITALVCYNILYLITGPDPALVNKEYFPLILAHTPAGTSFHTMNHYGQLVMSKGFSMYDYGRRGNKKHYGQKTPPDYKLFNVTTPVAIFWGQNDWLATPEDVARLNDILPNVIHNQRIAFDTFNHMDFTWAQTAVNLVYKDVMKIMDKY